MNGFYLVGSRSDLAQIKSDILEYGHLKQVTSFLKTWVPYVHIPMDPDRRRGLILEGSPGALEQAHQVLEMLEQLDKPLEP